MRPPSPARPLPALLGALAVLGDAAGAAAQSCAMCGSAFGADDPIGRAFSWSILFLMAAPYTVVGSIGLWLFFNYRRAEARRRAAVLTPRSGLPSVPAPEHQGDYL